MSYILVEDFKGGLDRRRTVVTSVPGTAYELTNCHITRGGEIEKRRAFVEIATCPNETHGLAAGGGRIYIFGSKAESGSNAPDLSSLPANVEYIKMEHAQGEPSPESGSGEKMDKVLSVDFFDGKVYAACQFKDGMIYHFWGSHANPGSNNSLSFAPNRITQWYDGRARVAFSITGGSAGGTAASTTLTVTGGSSVPGDELSKLRINNVDIITNVINHTGSNNTTATNLAAEINNTTSSPNYTASVAGAVVTITSSTVGTEPNGFSVVPTLAGSFTVHVLINTDGEQALSGGADNGITSITIDGKELMTNAVKWEISHSYTASKVAEELNDTSTSPEWDAISVDDNAEVNIIAELPGTQNNSKTCVVTKSGNLTVSSSSISTGTTGGSVSGGQQGGPFVKSIGNKMHSLAESNWHISKLADPTEWNPSTASSADVQNLSNHSRGAEELMAITSYFNNLAILGQDVIQIWFNDPDPDKNTQVQVLDNTGTVAAKSVASIGDSDVFYLARSGIRSLKSRDSSNAAYVGDIGNPVDDLVIADIQVDANTTSEACGILDPRDGRYLLAIGSKVYVFSFFPNSQISAWSIYEPGFTITDWAFDGKQVVCRSGNKIYSLGGELNNTYDNCKVTVQLPFLDAGRPGHNKMFTGLDAVCANDWKISVGTDPTDITQYNTAATLNKTTYGLGRVGLSSASTHIAIRMENESSGAAKLGNVAVHYETNESG